MKGRDRERGREKDRWGERLDVPRYIYIYGGILRYLHNFEGRKASYCWLEVDNRAKHDRNGYGYVIAYKPVSSTCR